MDGLQEAHGSPEITCKNLCTCQYVHISRERTIFLSDWHRGLQIYKRLETTLLL